MGGFYGFCGGHGYAFRKRAIERIVYHPRQFLAEYRSLCIELPACDLVTGVLVSRRGLKVLDLPFGSMVNNVDKAVFHRIYGDKMYRLHAMINTKTEPFNMTYANIEHWKK